MKLRQEHGMTAQDHRSRLREHSGDKILALHYGERDLVVQRKRLDGLLRRLAKTQPDGKAVVIRAPGRTELGGNHTDHNHGRVLAGAVDLDILAAAARTGERGGPPA